jgi:hypothetical protein
MAVDLAVFGNNERSIGIDHLRWAWANYFVSLDSDAKTGSYRALA